VSRPVIIVAVLLAIAAGSTITVLVMKTETPGPAGMSDDQRATRDKFFGADKELPPIEKGQEMRPRW
jgi:type IV secretion system protein TrbK